MAQYALARHVFACVQGEHVVFLDVRRDRYFAIEAARTAGLGDWVEGWPVVAPLAKEIAKCVGEVPLQRSPARRGTDEALASVISVLLEKGILTSAELGKAATPEKIPPPRGELGAEAVDDRPGSGVARLFRFCAAAVRARLLLKHRTFESVVNRVKTRVEKHGSDPRNSGESRVQELVATFAFLRPYFFSAKDACLFDALALSEYLAAYDVYPRWIFGVQARPFAAHCWLELNGIVLNDTVDHVRRYAPIMIV